MRTLPGFADDRWRTGTRWCLQLAREHGLAALQHGWTAPDLFGLHPTAPAARYDAMGVAFLMRARDRILSFDNEHPLVLRATGAVHRFVRGSHSPESRPAWQLPFTISALHPR
jgi:hypothetical protein